MAPVLHDVLQRSEDWRLLRLGRVTSSVVADMLSTTKAGLEAAGRRNLRTRLMLERITGRSLESEFENDAMRRGRDLEPDAIGAYEAANGCVVQPIGFYTHPTLMAGASPDGVVNDTGLVEIKVPLPSTHLETLKTKHVPDAYLKQIVHQLLISERPWCDYVSYGPEFPSGLRLFQYRIYASALDLKAYEQLLRIFLAEVDSEVTRVLALQACDPSQRSAATV